MAKVLVGITTSVDGYICGPRRRSWTRAREGGERLHSWVFGGRWSYDAEPRRRGPRARTGPGWTRTK